MSLSQLVKETWEGSCKGAHRVGVADEIEGISSDTGQTDLFTITGGPIIVTNMWGMVTVVIGSGGGGSGTLLILNHNPASAAPQAAISAVVAATIVNDLPGTMYTWSGAVAGVMAVGAQLGVGSVGDSLFVGEFIVLVPGVITLRNIGTDDAQTGNIDWYINYIPCTPNAIVQPA